jgi:hypothetical protein
MSRFCEVLAYPRYSRRRRRIDLVQQWNFLRSAEKAANDLARSVLRAWIIVTREQRYCSVYARRETWTVFGHIGEDGSGVVFQADWAVSFGAAIAGQS